MSESFYGKTSVFEHERVFDTNERDLYFKILRIEDKIVEVSDEILRLVS